MSIVFNVVNGLSFGALLFLLSVGLSLTFGVMRLVNLAHGSLFLIGAYTAYSLRQAPGGWVTAIVGGALMAGAVGLVLERVFLRPFRHNHLAQVLLTLGMIFIIQDVTGTVWGRVPLGALPPEWAQGGVSVGGLTLPHYRLFLVGLGALTFVAMWWLMNRSQIGAMVRASVDDEEMARAVGLRTGIVTAGVFAVGAMLAGFGGATGLPFLGAYPGLDLRVLLYSLVVVIIGGVGSITGTFVAAMMVGIADTLTRAYAPSLSLFIIFAAMAIVLLVRPTGLFGREVAETLTIVDTRPGFLPRLLSWPRARLEQLPRMAWVVGAAVLASVALVAPLFVNRYQLTLIALACAWALLAISTNLVLGYGGLVSLGQAAFFGIGGYTVGLFAVHLGWRGPLVIIVAVLLGTVASVLAGVLLLRRSGLYFMMLTVALAQVLWAVAFQWRNLTGGADGLAGIIGREAGATAGLRSPTVSYYVMLAVVIACTIGAWHFRRSAQGYALIGIRENVTKMALMGYNVRRVQLRTFAVAGALAGLGGSLFAYINAFLHPIHLGLESSAQSVIMVLLGGSGTVTGPILGALIVVNLENFVSTVTDHWPLVLGLVYVFVVVVAPKGLVGSLERERTG